MSCKNDEAVSPVIGVILMVAITVILAAVIAVFVFGTSGNIPKIQQEHVVFTILMKEGNLILTTENENLYFKYVNSTLQTKYMFGLLKEGKTYSCEVFDPEIGFLTYKMIGNCVEVQP